MDTGLSLVVPTDLPEGEVVYLQPVEADDMSNEERDLSRRSDTTARGLNLSQPCSQRPSSMPNGPSVSPSGDDGRPRSWAVGCSALGSFRGGHPMPHLDPQGVELAGQPLPIGPSLHHETPLSTARTDRHSTGPSNRPSSPALRACRSRGCIRSAPWLSANPPFCPAKSVPVCTNGPSFIGGRPLSTGKGPFSTGLGPLPARRGPLTIGKGRRPNRKCRLAIGKGPLSATRGRSPTDA